MFGKKTAPVAEKAVVEEKTVPAVAEPVEEVKPKARSTPKKNPRADYLEAKKNALA